MDRIRNIISNPELLKEQEARLASIGDQFARAITWDDSSFQTWWAQASADDALLGLLPDIDSVRDRYHWRQVQQALLSAGMDILQNRPGQLSIGANLNSSGQSFTYVVTATGFELQSTKISWGKPVTLSFTTPAQAPVAP